jgi:hypothetical protein
MNNKERQDNLEQHSDDAAVDRFAMAMKEKLAKARAKGRSGWDDPEKCKVEYLSQLLHEHVAKGDPVDVSNLAMMLHQRGSGVIPQLTKCRCFNCQREFSEIDAQLIDMDTNTGYRGCPGCGKAIDQATVHVLSQQALPNREAIVTHDDAQRWLESEGYHVSAGSRTATIPEAPTVLLKFVSHFLDNSDQAGDGGELEVSLDTATDLPDLYIWEKDNQGTYCLRNTKTRIVSQRGSNGGHAEAMCKWLNTVYREGISDARAKAKPIDSIKVGEGDNTDTEP